MIDPNELVVGNVYVYRGTRVVYLRRYEVIGILYYVFEREDGSVYSIPEDLVRLEVS